jgi:hypothetical protein
MNTQNTQLEALRLADALEQGRLVSKDIRKETIAELRRLYEENQMLLETMQTIVNISLMDKGHWAKTIETEAHNAILKATGESK